MATKCLFRWMPIVGAGVLFSAAIAPRNAAAQAPTSPTDGPVLKWDRRGASTGRPLVFLPALGLPGKYWHRVYQSFEATNPIYVVTFAGSGGVPSTRPPYLDRSIEAIHSLIVSEKLKDPVLIGHYYGTHVALRVAAEYPTEVGGVFGIPLVVSRAPYDKRREAGERVTESYLERDKELWLPELIQQIRMASRRGETVDLLVEMVKETDRETYARTLGEVTADPIEKCLEKIQCPVYFIAPVPLRTRRETIEQGQERLAAMAQSRTDLIRALYPNLARCDVHALRHVELYPMLDSPGRVVLSLERFLKRLNDPKSHWDSTILETPGTRPSAP